MAEPLRCGIPIYADHAQLYELLVSELADFAVFLIDPTGCITSWNAGVERILGYTEAEWLERPVHMIFTPEDQAAQKPEEEMKNAARDGRAVDIRWHQRKDGSKLFFEGTMVALKDGMGRLLGFSKVMRDVTERHQTEAILRQSEAKYRTLFESIDEGFCIIQLIFDENGKARDYRYLEANSVFDQQSGLVDVIGRTIREFAPDHEEYWFQSYGKVALTGEAVRFENYSAELKRWFDVYAFRIGEPEEQRVAVLFKDVTAQKEALTERERLLQQIGVERQRLQQVFSQAPVAVVVLRGPEFVIELANPFYHNLVPARELVGRRFAEIVPELGSDVWAAFHHVIDTGEPYIRDDFYIPYDQNGDGLVEDHWFNVVYHPLREVDGVISGLVSVCTEVTSQMRARQELERVNRGLEEFAYVASHDLQEPLRMVNSYSQLLIRRSGQEVTDEQREFVGFIQRGVKRMEQLIRDLLTYSRTVHTVGELAMHEAGLNDALRQALTAVDTSVAESGATITYEGLPTVRGDTMQMAHVFQNILSNALKYRKSSEPPRIHISAHLRAREWVIAVRDNGIGFDPGQAERIFGLFKRLHTEKEYAGTGLGLAICQRIVERFGGKMWAESEPGIGSTFFFSLPGVWE